MVVFVRELFETFPTEGAIVGRMLLGFGELEYLFADCLSTVLQDRRTGFRVLFRIRGDDSRFMVADALMRPAFAKAGLAGRYERMWGQLKHCKTIRNQYAHCHWERANGKLYLTNYDEAAKKSSLRPFQPLLFNVDATLLALQEKCFQDTLFVLFDLSDEYANHLRDPKHKPGPIPRASELPPPHNPHSSHPPPNWSDVG